MPPLRLRSLLISINIILGGIFITTLVTISSISKEDGFRYISDDVPVAGTTRGGGSNEVQFNSGDEIITTTAFENDLQKEKEKNKKLEETIATLLAQQQSNSAEDTFSSNSFQQQLRQSYNHNSNTTKEEDTRRGPYADIISPHIGYKKVLVTGAAGFVGSHVAEALLARGDDVVIVDEMNDYYDVRMKEKNIQRLVEMYPDEKRLAIYRGDICDEEFMLQLFEKEHPQWVCHMAARAGVRPSIQDPFPYIHSNIEGTTHLMELSHKFGVKNFVFASSSSLYGGSKNAFFSEDENVDNPISPYAASKKACELLAYTYHHLYQLNVTGLRFFTVYGPRGRPDMAPFKFVDHVSRGLELQQFGDGSSSRDYTYIDDIVDGVLRAIDRPYKYEIINLGKGSGASLREFLDIVQKHVGKKAIIKILPDQLGDLPYTCANVSKAYDLLGYRASVPLDEGIKKTVDWYVNEYRQNMY